MENYQKPRCLWVPSDNPLYIEYHDNEWGVPVYDDRKLFEMLILEGFQAGLSWITILRKREKFRQAFFDFDAEKVAAMNQQQIATLLSNDGIIRNKLKIGAAIQNARIFLSLQEKHGSFSNYFWGFSNGAPIINYHSRDKKLPATSQLSVTISRELKKQGMRFVGPTIIYSFMQAVGMVNDHETECFRFQELQNKNELP